ncbi:MAG: AraC-like DNA-binding protein [Halioglobus sp.]|jgi:AraC-like DNA-binding protein
MSLQYEARRLMLARKETVGAIARQVGYDNSFTLVSAKTWAVAHAVSRLVTLQCRSSLQSVID